ncbi:hypothetical protein GNZ01_06515 [Escherichia coli]|uniref:Macro domain-containing protein n=2 Tax=root TaxID=1 RepID=A0AAJ3CW87_ECOLX|nr:macro domain-containing protein [Escherichia coli]MED6536436.1 macro domain-containing protein [Escherichia coli O157]QBO61867.1 hypothetical protein G17_00378 [Escherichia phage vB_EcoM_G17]WNN14695.1 Macro domain protein [Escherichia phage Sharanji]SCA80420.1 Macro domain protein [Escherichia phage vB_Eco_slurp01]EGE5868035.1 macro domain-containing protein [Escherichia coli]
MIHEHRGNLFELFSTVTDDQNALHIIAHGCNAQGKMGSGFAKELRNRYPMAYDDYKAYEKEMGFLRIGQIAYSAINDNLIIANCITQKMYGNDGAKYVSYDAIDDVFKHLNYFCKVDRDVHVHFPKIGADLGGGNWNVIKEIIDHRLVNAEKHLYILK